MSGVRDPMAGLLDLIRDAAREGAAQALLGLVPREPSEPDAPTLLDKRALAHALSVSTATVDRLCRTSRIPFVRVGDARRFDLTAVRTALADPCAQAEAARSTTALSQPAQGVKLLTRGSGR